MHQPYPLPFLPGLPLAGFKTYAAWPVWKDSSRQDVRTTPLPKKLATRLYHKARRFNGSTRIEGRYGGVLGSAAMRVLESLLFDFLNYTSGRCDPSYNALAAKTGLSRSTVAVALARLKKLRIIHWVRRCAEQIIEGRFELRQETNAYAVLPASHWLGFEDWPDTIAPDRGTWGDHPPLPSVLGQALEDRKAGASLASTVRALELDPDDMLSRALARLAQKIAAREAKA